MVAEDIQNGGFTIQLVTYSGVLVQKCKERRHIGQHIQVEKRKEYVSGQFFKCLFCAVVLNLQQLSTPTHAGIAVINVSQTLLAFPK